MYFPLYFQPTNSNSMYNEAYSLINILINILTEAILITFGGMIHTVYGANFTGHLISLFVDRISTDDIRIRLNPRPKQPITAGFDSSCSLYVVFNGFEYFVFNKNVCPTCNYHLFIYMCTGYAQEFSNCMKNCIPEGRQFIKFPFNRNFYITSAAKL